MFTSAQTDQLRISDDDPVISDGDPVRVRFLVRKKRY